MTRERYVKFVWITLAYTVGVILWGAFVRATGSGAGCGSHWPTCNGQVIPRPEQIETVIEFTHRITSAFAGLLTIGMLVWAFRLWPKGHEVRKGAVWTMIFMLIEGALGAGLVLFELVADNASMARATAAALHLANTYMLVAFITLTGWWAAGNRPMRLRGQGSVGWMVAVGFVGFILLGASGAVTALGDTLFRPETLAEGIQQKFEAGAHFLVQLRIIHPIIATVLGVYLIVIGSVLVEKRPFAQARRFVNVLKITFGIQFAIGIVNVLLLAPIWMQIVHLLVAEIVWIAAILLAASVLADRETVPAAEPTAVLAPQAGD